VKYFGRQVLVGCRKERLACPTNKIPDFFTASEGSTFGGSAFIVKTTTRNVAATHPVECRISVRDENQFTEGDFEILWKAF
jgi:hypothetical protein